MEPKKFAFGFSKIAKKPALLTPKPVETVEYVKCVEDNSVKLVNEELAKPKALPIIPMPKGSSVKDRILDAIKAREMSKNEPRAENSANKEEDSTMTNGETKILTLDELAAKELIEGATSEKKKEDLVITKATEANREVATLDDYENMPIADYGQAMLRGMGWDPKKGIGLSEKVVVPNIPQVRPKGMGLGADKMASQTAKSNSEEVMRRGSMVKVISGPHSQLYGKVEAFEELPGRILVRLALGNEIVSMGEFMVRLVPLSEFSKNAKVMNLDKYNAALESKNVKKEREIKTEQKSKPCDDRKSQFSESNRGIKYSKLKDDTSRRYPKSRDSSSSSGDGRVKTESRSRGESPDRRMRRDKQRDFSDKKKHRKKKSKKRSSETSSDEDKRRRKRDKKRTDKERSKRRQDSDSESSNEDCQYKKRKSHK